jgi:hypothetical protein
MQSKGFEPLSVATLELESNALDRSATIAGKIKKWDEENVFGVLIF